MKGIGYLILAGIVAVMVIPVLFTPFSLIDDPQMYEKYLLLLQRAESNGLSGAVNSMLTDFPGFPGINEGRFALLTWSKWMLQFSLAGQNPKLHYLFNSGIILLTGSVLGRIIERLYNRQAAWLSLVLFWLSYWGYENWMRLSTQELLQGLLFLGLILATLVGKTVLLITGLTAGIILSKETSVLLSAFFWCWAGFDKVNRSKVLKTAVIYTVISLIVLVIWKTQINTSKWTGVNAGLGNILPSLATYMMVMSRLWLWPVTAVVAGVWVIIGGKSPKKQLSGAILMVLLAASALASLLPWKFALERYLWIFGIGISGTIGITLTALYEYKPKRPLFKWLAIGVVVLILGRYMFIQLTERVRFTSHHLAREGANWQMLKWVATLPSESRVVVNVSRNHFDAQEWVLQINKAERLFFKREDIRVGFIDGQDQDYGYVLDWSMYRNDKLPQGLRVFNSEYQATAPTQSLRMWAKFLLSGNKELILIKNSYWWKAYEVPERRETSQM